MSEPDPPPIIPGGRGRLVYDKQAKVIRHAEGRPAMRAALENLKGLVLLHRGAEAWAEVEQALAALAAAPASEPRGCPTPGCCSALGPLDALQAAMKVAEGEREALVTVNETLANRLKAAEAQVAGEIKNWEDAINQRDAAEARVAALEGARWKAAVIAIHTTVIKGWRAWGPEDRRFLALALAGEVGEVANLVKKEWRGDTLPTLVADLTAELGDCRIYLELLAVSMGVDLDAVCERIVRDKLIPRWPQAKDAIDAALARAAGGAETGG